MNLGQMMLVLGAIVLLGILILNANVTLLDTREVQHTSEFGITAISLATSLVEEAGGKLFDNVVVDTTAPVVSNTSQLSTVLGPEAGEAYRDSSNGFDDYDDFNNLYVVYHNPDTDSALTPGAYNIAVPGIRARYFARCSVTYVNASNLDGTTTSRTWHKKIIVRVWSSASKDTLDYPSVMSYWN
jgi:hypothetical protein